MYVETYDYRQFGWLAAYAVRRGGSVIVSLRHGETSGPGVVEIPDTVKHEVHGDSIRFLDADVANGEGTDRLYLYPCESPFEGHPHAQVRPLVTQLVH